MGGLFSKTKMPEVKPTAPLPNEDQIKKSARRRTAKSRKESGAESTLLSTGGRETLGA